MLKLAYLVASDVMSKGDVNREINADDVKIQDINVLSRNVFYRLHLKVPSQQS